jgi:hypothetical protein
MNLTILYKPDSHINELKDDVVLNEILEVCGVTATARPMVVHYEANAPIAVLQPFGYVPVFQDELKINCPFPPDQITTLVNQLRPTSSNR